MAYSTTQGLCGAGDQTQSLVHMWQAFYPLSYTCSLPQALKGLEGKKYDAPSCTLKPIARASM